MTMASSSSNPQADRDMEMMEFLIGELTEQGRYTEAAEVGQRLLEKSTSVLGPEHELTIKTLKNIGQVYMMQGDSHLAISVLLRALELSERLFGSEHSTTSRIQDDLTKIRGPQDSLALRQMLAIKHGLPIPSDPLAGIRSMNRSQLLRRYQNVTSIMSGGPEVTNAAAMRFSEEIGDDPQPPIHIPSAYSDGDESNDDDSTGMYPEQWEIRIKVY
jgi:tetratricopeptide (TPR) repeat protein